MIQNSQSKSVSFRRQNRRKSSTPQRIRTSNLRFRRTPHDISVPATHFSEVVCSQHFGASNILQQARRKVRILLGLTRLGTDSVSHSVSTKREIQPDTECDTESKSIDREKPPTSFYVACQTCTAKFFSGRRIKNCPRCGSGTLPSEVALPPWRQSADRSSTLDKGSSGSKTPAPQIVSNLGNLITAGHRFSTVLADPPWRYDNTASRAAAENHYPTMSVAEICEQPIAELVKRNAHLHLWTTNAFLESAFDVIRAWGFEFKSLLVWVKPKIGLGNYWRVSHEFLLLGVRGRLPFQRKDIRSWQAAARERHSRKPFKFRELVEQVSPGPYLELFGREEQHDSQWTVYGNDVERRLF